MKERMERFAPLAPHLASCAGAEQLITPTLRRYVRSWAGAGTPACKAESRNKKNININIIRGVEDDDRSL